MPSATSEYQSGAPSVALRVFLKDRLFRPFPMRGIEACFDRIEHVALMEAIGHIVAARGHRRGDWSAAPTTSPSSFMGPRTTPVRCANRSTRSWHLRVCGSRRRKPGCGTSSPARLSDSQTPRRVDRAHGAPTPTVRQRLTLDRLALRGPTIGVQEEACRAGHSITAASRCASRVVPV